MDVLRPGLDDLAVVKALADPVRTRAAFRELLRRGASAMTAIRAGLNHRSARVRSGCCELLDRLLVPDALGELIDRLDDPKPGVRVAALHALACDRCKEGQCRPDEGVVLPRALRILASDPEPGVRNMAAELVGRYVHVPEAAAALVQSREQDPSPKVRKKAGWYAPGGPTFRKRY